MRVDQQYIAGMGEPTCRVGYQLRVRREKDGDVYEMAIELPVREPKMLNTWKMAPGMMARLILFLQ